jgi:hypothetical protein
VAAEGLDVLAQRRHLERPAVDHDRDGSRARCRSAPA